MLQEEIDLIQGTYKKLLLAKSTELCKTNLYGPGTHHVISEYTVSSWDILYQNNIMQ